MKYFTYSKLIGKLLNQQQSNPHYYSFTHKHCITDFNILYIFTCRS